jgi:hypothetical protein
MEITLHDNTPAAPGEKHGRDGPTHAGSVRVDYEYQAEMRVQDIEKDPHHIVRVWVPDLGREWLRIDGKFVEQHPGLDTAARTALTGMGGFLSSAQKGCPVDLHPVVMQTLAGDLPK